MFEFMPSYVRKLFKEQFFMSIYAQGDSLKNLFIVYQLRHFAYL